MNEDELLWFAALVIIAIGIFAYIALLQLRQHKLQKEAQRLLEMVESGKRSER